MQYEVVDSKNKTMFYTTDIKCIHTIYEINLMFLSGYKFKLDGKFLNKTKLIEKLKQYKGKELI